MRVRNWLPLHLAPEMRPDADEIESWNEDRYQAWLDASPQDGRCQHVVLLKPARVTYLRGKRGVWCGNKLPCGNHDANKPRRKVRNDVDRYSARRAERRYRITIGGVPLGLLLELRTSRHAEQIMATLDAIADA